MFEQQGDQLAELRVLSDECGFFEVVDTRHRAFHITGGESLLVTFESGSKLWGPTVARALDASLLMIHADGPTWFRSPALFDFIDDLTDDGFFDDFEEVLFAGAGMGAYGAGAYCVAAPGCEVLLMQPVATLERAKTPWEMRNRKAWKLSWKPRYSYAPCSVEAANHVTVISDPTETLDAMHASLFQGSNTTHLRIPHAGTRVLSTLHGMDLLMPLCEAAMSQSLTPRLFSKLWRARRDYGPYLKGLMSKLTLADRKILIRHLCRHTPAPKETPGMRSQFDRISRVVDKAKNLRA
jgi:hypothetical protein